MSPAVAGWMFFAMGIGLMIVGLVAAGLVLYAGRCIQLRKNHLFILIVAGFECMMVPVGTVLGVFTIIILMRDTVKPLFTSSDSEQETQYGFEE
jgi:hypothetical protein